ncbi:MAG: hypothetical protein LBJ67_17015 [Planctomycetaceae bacterium]|jgi:hypothetical protein|nr:hypothetical protein [Planctomycetaceae bacterium]
MSRTRVGAVPDQANLDEQEHFLKTALDDEIARAKAGESVLVFVDAAHFVQAAFLGVLNEFCNYSVASCGFLLITFKNLFLTKAPRTPRDSKK